MNKYLPKDLFDNTSDYYEAVIRLYIRKHKIHVKKWYKSLNAASYTVFQGSRTVMLPVPKNRTSFLVCLHEIGHISEGSYPISYINEYVAEIFAITEGKKWDAETDAYEFKAKQYVLAHLVKDWNTGRIKSVRKEIREWLDINPRNGKDVSSN
jgi:hypothetical protein